MNHLLTNTFNIDTAVQQVQEGLYNGLFGLWGEIDGYGRVYKNKRSSGYVPEVYDSTTKDYKDVMYDNRTCFFFVDSDSHKSDDGIAYRTDMKVVFMVDLNAVKNASERRDSEVQRDAIEILRDYISLFQIDGIEKTVSRVFRDFDASKIDNNDMHPYHVFAVTGVLEYTIEDKC